MLRTKSVFAVLLMAALTGIASAQTPYHNPVCDPSSGSYKTSAAAPPVAKVIIAGSSAMWTTLALGAYNSGKGPVGAIANTHHYVGAVKFNLVDTRPKAFGAANAALTDTGNTWIVWDEHTVFVSGTGTVCAPNVWVYVNTDSVVGNRAVLGSIGAGGITQTGGAPYGVYVEAPTTGFPAGNNSALAPALWANTADPTGADDAVPANIQAMFAPTHESDVTPPNRVNVGATDIRPEDAFFAITRANSKLGGTSPDALDGLGYVKVSATGPNSTTPGAAPANCTGPTTQGATIDDLVGTPIAGSSTDYGGSFNVAAFNVVTGGLDPFTCAVLPTIHTIPVGATPIVFVHSNLGSLAGVKNASEEQLGQVFSGAAHDASIFGSTFSGNLAAILREPLSGTYNTTEMTVMRHPSLLATYRNSMETGVGSQNPLMGDGISTFRWRAIGTGNEVKAVKNSFSTNHVGLDAIGFTFFSYGNVNSIAGSTSYSYITLNSIDPIFHSYATGVTTPVDPGQPNVPGELPLNTPCGTGTSAFPCNENQIWASSKVGVLSPTGVVTAYDSYSFPNLRNGSYPAWSVVRLVAGPAYLNATTLVNASQQYVITTVPDYVPFAAVKSGTTVLDPGLTIVRSHYGCTQVTCGLNFFGTAVNPPSQGALERGRDAGGAIVPIGDIKVNYTQDGPQGIVVFE